MMKQSHVSEGGGPESPPDDGELVAIAQAAGAGDLRAFDELVLRHQARVLANCRYMTRSSADAEDLAQEVFVRAFFGLRNFRGDAGFGTWVRRIKVNHCLNYLKKRSRAPEAMDLASPALRADEALRSEPDGGKALEARDERARIDLVLDEMSDTVRVALLMRDLDEMSYQEIAQELGVGLSAAKMRVKRGREDFRRRYEQRFGPPGYPGAAEGGGPDA